MRTMSHKFRRIKRRTTLSAGAGGIEQARSEKRCVNYLETHTHRHHGSLASALGEEVTKIDRWSWLIRAETQTMRLDHSIDRTEQAVSSTELSAHIT